MKIVIEHGNVKREINGPFNILGSRADLWHIVRLLKGAIDQEHDPFHYGWVSIPDIVQPSIVNTPPKKWDE